MSDTKKRPSASIMTRVYHCPASFRLNSLETPESSEAAEEGTKLHRVCELLMSKNPNDAEKSELKSLKESLDDEQLDTVKYAFKSAKKLVEKSDIGREIRTEWRLWAKTKLFSGQSDLCIIERTPRRATIVDYKFGRGEVERAESNLQLAALAVLLDDNMPGVFDSIEVLIIQPRALERNKRIVTCLFERDAIDDAREALNAACLEALESNEPRQECGYWCKYCPSAYRCLRANRVISNQMSLATAPAGRAITAANALKEYELCLVAKKFVDARLEAIKSFVHSNPDCDCGLVLKPGTKRANLGNANEIFAIVERAGVTPDEFVGVCDVGLTKLQTLYHEKRKLENSKQTKKASDVELKNALSEAGLLTYKESVPTLAKAE